MVMGTAMVLAPTSRWVPPREEQSQVVQHPYPLTEAERRPYPAERSVWGLSIPEGWRSGSASD
jgi:hypothetical protein